MSQYALVPIANVGQLVQQYHLASPATWRPIIRGVRFGGCEEVEFTPQQLAELLAAGAVIFSNANEYTTFTQSTTWGALPIRWIARLFDGQLPLFHPAHLPLPELVPDEERVPASSFAELLALGEGRYGIGSPLTLALIAQLRSPRTPENPIGTLLHPEQPFVIEHDGFKVTRIRPAGLSESPTSHVVYWPHRWASQNPEYNCDLIWWYFVRGEERSLANVPEPWTLELQADG